MDTELFIWQYKTTFLTLKWTFQDNCLFTNDFITKWKTNYNQNDSKNIVAERRYKMGCHVEICYLDDFSLWNWWSTANNVEITLTGYQHYVSEGLLQLFREQKSRKWRLKYKIVEFQWKFIKNLPEENDKELNGQRLFYEPMIFHNAWMMMSVDEFVSK